MYFIEEDVTFKYSFGESVVKKYHIVARYTIDIVNNTTEIILASYNSYEEMRNKSDSGYTSFLTLNDTPKFGVEPTLFALRVLTSVEDSPLFRKEIKLNKEILHSTQLFDEQ